MLRAYFRCMDGHYFAGTTCPLDGWSCAAAREVAAATEKVVRGAVRLSIERLQAEGVTAEALRQTLVVEFGHDGSAFDLIDGRDL